MMNTGDDIIIKVGDETELLEAVTQSAAESLPIEVTGSGSRRQFGRPVDGGRRLDLSGLDGITMYEPDELVLTAKAATPLATILQELDKHNQILAFDPVLGGDSLANAMGTIGGVLASNLSGSRRLTAGAARDYLLGFKAVSGRAALFQSGSRVMKNVTGYDLSKLMAGSWGTLAIMHEVTIKTMPKPETSASLLYACADAMEARSVIEAAFASPHEPSAAAMIPASLAVYSSHQPFSDFARTGMVAVIRLEGFETSVKARSDALYAMTEKTPVVTDHALSDALQAEIRETRLMPRQNNRVIWKINCPPAEGGELLDKLIARPNCRGYADWGGGLIWLSSPSGQQAGATAIRALVSDYGGEAMLHEAPEGMRRTLPVFHPQPKPLEALTRRIKSSFDPLGILNPGRMIAGI